MKHTKAIFASLFISTTVFAAAGAEPLLERAQKYHQRYQLNNVNDKLVNNTGDGYENLYGVRNFREVLKGILYRGGANNSYNKYGKRNNQNPLPTMGLKNLCNQGFGGAVYLYETNFSTAPAQLNCETIDGEQNELKYHQLTAANENNTPVYLEMIFKAIKGTGASPLYMHCWNGWHASGLVASLALRQFCGLSGQQALSYWMKNTDGNTDGYDSIKKRIVDFQPLSKFQVSEDERSQICN